MEEKILIENGMLSSIIKTSVMHMYASVYQEETDKLVIFGTNYNVEKYPTNWEELKELCEDLEGKDVFMTSAGDCIECCGVNFWVNGTINKGADAFDNMQENVSPSRMWNIIKNLVGDEK